MNFIGCENDNFQIFFFIFAQIFFRVFFFHFICARNIDCGYKLKPREYAQSIFQSKTTPPKKKNKKQKKKQKKKQTNKQKNKQCIPLLPSFIFFSFRCFIQGSDFPFFLIECIKASFYIYLSCKCVRFNAKKSMIKFDVNTKFDFTTFIPISKLIDNDACQVFIKP